MVDSFIVDILHHLGHWKGLIDSSLYRLYLWLTWLDLDICKPEIKILISFTHRPANKIQKIVKTNSMISRKARNLFRPLLVRKRSLPIMTSQILYIRFHSRRDYSWFVFMKLSKIFRFSCLKHHGSIAQTLVLESRVCFLLVRLMFLKKLFKKTELYKFRCIWPLNFYWLSFQNVNIACLLQSNRNYLCKCVRLPSTRVYKHSHKIHQCLCIQLLHHMYRYPMRTRQCLPKGLREE